MGIPRRMLFRSAIWEIARPRVPLTLGHLLVRLTDPSVSFTEVSAADWLLCHNIARKALTATLAAERFGLMFAYEWHPIGDAIGEPLAETSTPTFHLFGRWADEPQAPADQLLLPAFRRFPPAERLLDKLDEDLRARLQREAAARNPTSATGPTSTTGPTPTMGQGVALAQSGVAGPLAAGAAVGIASAGGAPAEANPGGAGRAEAVPAGGEKAPPRAPTEQLPAMAKWKASQEPGSGHRVFTPVRALRTVADASPAELLALATGLSALPRGGAASGFSCVAAEAGRTEERLQLHAFGRSTAEKVNPLEGLLGSTEVSHALL